jgi:aryl-alcohol dehydrogenase-like predicted oxidoreductase
MNMTGRYGPSQDRHEMIAFLRAAVDCGVTFFDTAEAYGPFTNETLLGATLQLAGDRLPKASLALTGR